MFYGEFNEYSGTMSLRILLLCVILVISCVAVTVATDCGCGTGPEGPPDYSSDPNWGSSLDDLMDGSSSSGDSNSNNGDTGSTDDSSWWDDSSGDSGSTGGADDSSSQDSSGSSYDSGSQSSSSDSASSSSFGGGSVENGLIWRMKGDELFKQGLYNESVEAYGKALQYDPYALKSWTGIGQVLLELERPAKAVEAYKKAIKLDPGDATLHALLGDALTESGSFDDAIESYQKALMINPRISGVSEKIEFAETARASIATTDDTPSGTLPLVNTTAPTIPPTESSSEITTEANQLPRSTQAAFPGIIAGLSMVIVCFAFLWKRNK